jgi:nanoRNase/pAp phosphatase (c-di-AMP/oligoRNAs hydrolase)
VNIHSLLNIHCNIISDQYIVVSNHIFEYMSSKHNKTFNYAIYHRGCLDGFSGFFVAHNSGRLTSDVIIYPDVPSARMVPPDIDGKDVIIIDVAYKKEILEEIIKHAKSVVFIDHHVSIADDVRQLKEKYNAVSHDKLKIVYDEKRSGATLAWKYFNSRQTAPLFLKYVEDQDTGTWEHENTKPFVLALKANYHLSTEGKSLNKWFRLMNKQVVLEMVEEGRTMQKYLIHLVNINLPRHSMHKFPSKKLYNNLKGDNPDLFKKPGQYKIALFIGFNCPSVTDLAVEALARIDCDFIIMWVYNLDRKEYVFSMRSKEVYVSEIAKAMGGGGHKLAAAFSFLKKNYEIDEMFEGGSLPRSLRSVEDVTETADNDD